MPGLRKSNAGFTLIELMIVVAIIGILSAIAIPNFIRFQLRSKWGEAKLNLGAIRTAEGSYFGEFGSYIEINGSEPQATGLDPTAPGSTKRRWSPCPALTTMASSGYCIMGFAPEGPTYYDYGVTSDGPGNAALTPGNVASEYFADALSDIDGDGVTSTVGLRVPPQGITNAMPGLTEVGLNGCAQVMDQFGNDTLYNTVGPCTIGDGTFVY